MDATHCRASFVGQPNHNGKLAVAGDEFFCAIQGIDNPDPIFFQPAQVIFGFFREDAVVGVSGDDAGDDVLVGRAVGLGHWLIRGFVLDFRGTDVEGVNDCARFLGNPNGEGQFSLQVQGCHCGWVGFAFCLHSFSACLSLFVQRPLRRCCEIVYTDKREHGFNL